MPRVPKPVARPHGSKREVFIAWSDIGMVLAKGLHAILLRHPAVHVFMSSEIDAGESWHEEVRKAAQKADFGIGCWTPGSSKSPWFHYEAGMISGLRNKFIVLRFDQKGQTSGGDDLPGPLQYFQTRNGRNRSDLVNVLHQLTGDDLQKCEERLDAKLDAWQICLEKYEHLLQSADFRLRENLAAMLTAGEELKQNTSFHENDSFQRIVLRSVERLSRGLKDLIRDKDSYRLPATDYPDYLVYLQKQEPQALVRAVALVETVEKFWHGMIADEIALSANKASKRVFAFETDEKLKEYLKHLNVHAAHYHVRAISMARLSGHPGYARDFSIIAVNHGRILARYEDDELSKVIHFEADPHSVELHWQRFDSIWNDAHDIKPLDTLALRVFPQATLAV